MSDNTLEYDLEELFPSEEFKIGNKVSYIKPLSFLQYQKSIKQLKNLQKEITDKGITSENWQSPDKFIDICEIGLEQFPDLLADFSGVPKEVIIELPIEYVIDLVSVVISVNLKSKDTLIKNFQGLVNKVASLLSTETK